MSKRINPIVGVLRYFESADLAQAEQALALAKEVIRRRTPAKVAPAPKKKAAPRKAAPHKETDVPLPGIGPAVVGN